MGGAQVGRRNRLLTLGVRAAVWCHAALRRCAAGAGCGGAFPGGEGGERYREDEGE